MGGELWLQFASKKEAERLRAYLGEDGTEMGVEDEYGWWFDWKGPRKLEIGYSSGRLSSEGSRFVGREIATRFRVTRIGADTVGWYSDKDWKGTDVQSLRESYGEVFTSWAEWLKAYRKEWTPSFRYLMEEGFDEMEQWVVAKFIELDQRD